MQFFGADFTLPGPGLQISAYIMYGIESMREDLECGARDTDSETG